MIKSAINPFLDCSSLSKSPVDKWMNPNSSIIF